LQSCAAQKFAIVRQDAMHFASRASPQCPIDEKVIAAHYFMLPPEFLPLLESRKSFEKGSGVAARKFD
jgi:hypothetical protein